MLTKTIALAAIMGLAAPLGTNAESMNPDPDYGVFLKLAENINGSFDETVQTTIDALGEAGWQVLADFEAGVDRGDCDYRAHVIVVNSGNYAEAVLAQGGVAAFALPLRLSVFEDERGIQLGAVNPLSLNRTIVSETGFAEQSMAIVEQLRSVAATAFPGHGSEVQYGQMRDRGLISRTMGLIAGGPFESKIETLFEEDLDGETLLQFATRLAGGFGDVGGSWRWDMRVAYTLDLAEHGVVVMGVTSEEMEAKSFHIVGNGGDRARRDFACAGLDHSPAYPIELVITTEGNRVVIRAVDAMFRMKMFFEDAGNMKFAANMRMPGTIEDEIRDRIDEVLY